MMSNRKALFLLISILCVLLSVVHPPPIQAEETLWAGILRMDGIIIPVSVYSDGIWKKAWTKSSFPFGTKPMPTEKVPASWLVASQRIPEEWFLIGGTTKPLMLKVKQVETYYSPAYKEWGFQTGYVDPKQKADGAIKGVAVGGKVVSGFQAKTVDPASDKLKGLIKWMETNFNNAEGNELRNNPSINFPDMIEKRVAENLFVDSAFEINTKSPARKIYYFELLRKYPFDADSGWNYYVESIYNCWVLDDGGSYEVLDAMMTLSNYTEANRLWITPAGLILIENKEYLIYQVVGNELHEVEVRLLDKHKVPLVFSRSSGPIRVN